MAKSSGFKALQRALWRASFLQRHPDLRSALEDLESARGGANVHDRRAFLRASLKFGALGASTVLLGSPAGLKRALAREAQSGSNDGEGMRDGGVVVLGGGLAGLTATYRLASSGVSCELFEAQDRLGGRVFTKNGFNEQGMFCELGGELIDSDHAELVSLARELGLELEDFRPYDAGVKEHQYFIAGGHYFDDDLVAASGPLARKMAADIHAAFPDPQNLDCTYSSHTDAAVKLDRMSVEEYLASVPDLDRWVRDGVGMAYLTEFGLDLGEQSALNLITLMGPSVLGPSVMSAEYGLGIFGLSNEAMRVKGGNSRLPEALARAIEARDAKGSGARINLGQRLVKIRDTGTRLELTFEARAGGIRVVRPSRVICTIPFTLLRDIDGVRALELSPIKRRAIQEFGYGTNIKHMVGFKSRHWREPQPGIPANSGYTFTDLSVQTQWDSSRLQPGNRAVLVTFMGGRAAADPRSASLESILRDTEAISPGSRELFDGNHAIMRWPQNPFARASYACPRPGQYTTLGGSLKEPELGGRLLFAGEHVSEESQGYMNGAVETGNKAALAVIQELGVKPGWRLTRGRYAQVRGRIADPVAY